MRTKITSCQGVHWRKRYEPNLTICIATGPRPVYAFSKTEMSCAFPVSTNYQVIGLSSSGNGTRRRRKRSIASASGGALEGGGVAGEVEGDGQENTAPAPNGAETEDPDIIIARRNAEHRRMQVSGSAHTQIRLITCVFVHFCLR